VISASDNCRVVADFATVARDKAVELAADGAGADVVGLVMERVDAQGCVSVVAGMEPPHISLGEDDGVR
jgi:hypothetical protein